MATRFYLNNATSLVIPTTIRGTWDSNTHSIALMMGTNKFGDPITSVDTSESSVINPTSVLILRGVSSRLQAQTISGYMDVILGIKESSSDADFYWKIHVYVLQGDTDLLRGTLITNYSEITTNEWPTTTLARSFQFAVPLDSVIVNSGDRIVVEIGYISRNATTSNRTGTLWYGTQIDPTLEDAPDLAVTETTVAIKAGSINFTQNLLFQPVISSVGHIEQQIVEYNSINSARIIHEIVQVGLTSNPDARIAHELIQVVGRDTATSRIAHIIIQVVKGSDTTPPIQPLPEVSGIYFIKPGKTHDSYYNGLENKIPDPTIRVPYIGE